MQNDFSHAYIVSGSAEYARNLAAALVCSSDGARPCGVCPHCRKALRESDKLGGIHPDIITISPLEGKAAISVDQIREVTSSAVVAPNEAATRVFVIEDADTMNASCQNALLKLLEEPPAHVALILRASEPGALLPTVRSRCRIVYEDDADAAQSRVSERATQLARDFFAAVGDDSAITRFSFELEKLERADFPGFIQELRRCAGTEARKAALNGNIPPYLARAQGVFDELDTYLEHNVSAAHISAKLCAEFMTI
jgi:hypothetical protein